MRRSKYCVPMETIDGVEIWVEAEPEKDISPEREGREIGGGAHGKEFVRVVRKAVKEFGRWGWCTIAVHAVKGDKTGTTYLGCCSYKSAEDFKEGGYYPQMVRESMEDLAAEPVAG